MLPRGALLEIIHKSLNSDSCHAQTNKKLVSWEQKGPEDVVDVEDEYRIAVELLIGGMPFTLVYDGVCSKGTISSAYRMSCPGAKLKGSGLITRLCVGSRSVSSWRMCDLGRNLTHGFYLVVWQRKTRYFQRRSGRYSCDSLRQRLWREAPPPIRWAWFVEMYAAEIRALRRLGIGSRKSPTSAESCIPMSDPCGSSPPSIRRRYGLPHRWRRPCYDPASRPRCKFGNRGCT